ncbi:HalOD1 output domain-containing protein [Haloplanus litoreus]|uniref:HalOD1 output domain-containing protein n=1 Tax=Haloplanus litoreus TaxID=767515 RepID=A0ABD5ZYN4_9EURY
MIDSDGTHPTWDADRRAYVTRFDGTGRPPSVAVAVAVAAVLDESPRPLFDYVDPDALDDLFVDSAESTTITVDVDGAVVTVRGDGRVFVRPP